ncbi:DNA polymerase III subunit alpha [Thioalkalivibrio sp. XN8]|uniref:DNA polymerase III subunit alpha n=1 Tax=Thioalkalivibrio sp. XN8 TaxID=2712863 RepID=UPI0013ED1BBD|nr:DNA polymerase III subunit alpha [Thioalkalivibrio sp. XN8]NGP53612.1 DNA polymerase III subunit alpha [Thioalkalivibrio sp. XN8]
MTTPFIHLRLHTEYSLADSVIRIPALLARVAELGMPAVAVTDQVNLFGMVKFYRGALRQGIKPLVGADIWLDEPGDPRHPTRLSLLCGCDEGYRNLCRLLSRAYLEGRRLGQVLVRREWLDPQACGGLIALSAAREGDVGRALMAGRRDTAEACLAFWRERFPERYYLELQRTGREGDEYHVAEAVSLAAATGTPVVATNDVRFLDADDFDAHEARVCIHQGHTLSDPRRPRDYSAEQYLKSAQEMAALFADLPEALENSVEIARRCNLELRLGETFLPDFPVPAGEDAASHLRKLSAAALAERLPALLADNPVDDAEAYRARLQRELDVICDMGFPGYFLIVADFIRWAKDNDIPVGPGRGSGAGSLVAFVLGITDLDPLRYDLLFERFLNPERVSMPDFDIDFCINGRDRVIDYVAQRYGRESVAQIITYGSMAAKAVVRDVGRVLGHPYGFTDRIAKLIPFEVGMTLDKALSQEPELKRNYEEEDEVRGLIDLAKSLEGLARNAGRHAGGVVIAPTVLTDFTPLYCEEGSEAPVTQFDKDDVEAAGLVKFDFLGLRTLTIIDRAVHRVNDLRAAAGEPPLDMARIPLDDPLTFQLLRACRTTAVFQLESRGMKDLIKRLQPDSFDDIVALVALFRPGPLQSGMVDDYINRKHGRQDGPIDYFHPELEPVLKPTYGVILYQEQVMQIAQVLAGYSLGAADLLRRAMGKKKPEEMAKQRSIFVEGAVARDVDRGTATHIFDLMEKFAGYGFNKSHSAAYAMLSYQTAWLKAHYPEAFMASVLSTDMDHTDKIVTLIDECHQMGLVVEPPDVNESEHAFNVAGKGRLRYGLGAIKGVGQAAVQAIIDERKQGGRFESLTGFCARIDLQRVNRRTIEALVRAGALDSIGPNRATLMHRLPGAIGRAEQSARAAAAGQEDLFGMAAAPGPEAASDLSDEGEALPEWSSAERLAGERDTLGLFLTGHPVDEVAHDLAALAGTRIGELAADRPTEGERSYAAGRRDLVVGGLIVDMRRRGNRITLVLDDRSGRLEVTLFEETYQQCRHVVAKDAIIIAEGNLRFDDFIDDWRLTARRVVDLDTAMKERGRRLMLRCALPGPDFVGELQHALEPFRGGGCQVTLVYQAASAKARVELGPGWAVRPSLALLHRVGGLVGADNVRMLYGDPASGA